MSDPVMSAILQIVTVLGVNGLFAGFFLWERRRSQFLADSRVDEQKKLYDAWLKEQRELYERYLEDMRDWNMPRDRNRPTYQPGQMHAPGGGEARAFSTREISPVSAGD